MKSQMTCRRTVTDYMRIAANWRRWAVLICTLAVVPAVFAQGVSGRIVGTVVDQTGADIANAKITVTNQDTGLSVVSVSDSRGDYQANNLPPGNYQLKVEAAGMQTMISNGIVVTVDNATPVPVTLQVGTANQSITVTTASPLIDTTSSSLGEVLNAKEVTTLPLNGR